MIDAGIWAVAGVVTLWGVVLGAVFFGGLWWTVQRSAVSTVPVRWFVGSVVLRTVVVMAGFYMVGAGQPMLTGLCLLGFLLARVIVLRVTRPTPAAKASATWAPP